MAIDREALKATLVEYTCGQRCMGEAGNKGGCCSVGSRDFIIGPITDADAFLARLGGKLCRSVPRDEAFVEYAEGSALFPERPMWQDPRNYPALRVVMDGVRNGCKFYDAERGACSVYDVRPAVCRNYACEPLANLLTLV